jgi:hypothetical protein
MRKLSIPLLFIQESLISVKENSMSVLFMQEKKTLGGFFENEVAGWERAFAYEE